jgi:hypothetical protein
MSFSDDEDTGACGASSHLKIRPRTLLLWAAIWAAYIAILIFVPRPANVVAGLVAALLISMAVIMFAWRLAQRTGGPMDKLRPAGRRYTLRFLPAMMVYAAIFVAATAVWKQMHPHGLAAVALGLAPSLPILFAIRAMMLYLKEETDEYLRSRMLESWSLATGFALCICTVWGFLDQFEVVPHLPLWAAFPLWAVCLVPAQWLRRDA